MISFADSLYELKPDLLILLGDRFEMLAAASAAHLANIPIAHISGGEITEGSFDDAIRHSITKMSWWHFVAAEDYRKRVIQLGEDPQRVHLVGGMGVDGIKNAILLSKSNFEKEIGFNLGRKNLLVTYHPVTLENETSKDDFNELLKCLDQLNNTNIIFTLANSDTHGRVINSMIHSFVDDHPTTSKAFISMGQINYLSALQYVDAVVGNSSSGLLEAPTFKIGTINIGDRQKGRLKAHSVIDCVPSAASITSAIEKLYSTDLQTKLKTVKNPYGDGNSSEKIVNILKQISIDGLTQKRFID